MIKFAILGPGKIARCMAQAVAGTEGVVSYAVASRDMERAKDFADEWGFEKAYGSYEEMLADTEVNLVYVATPHSFHYEHAKLCLDYGKHVLVEKPFTVNSKQAKELLAYAKEKGCLIAEAMWTRFMPSRQMIDDILASGVIGTVSSVTANLGYEMTHKERLVEPHLAGGALLDVGIYPINFARMIAKEEVVKITSDAVMSSKGVDLVNSVTLTFKNNILAILHSSMLADTDRLGVVYGDKGYLEVQNINNCEEIRVYNNAREMTAKYQVPKQINGYEYEVIACKNAIESGVLECKQMPHSETIYMLEIMDAVRKQWNMKYPFEELDE